MKTLFTSIALIFVLSTNAQSIIGKWKMVGMKSGKERSLIQIYEKDGKYFGKVIDTYPAPGDDPNPKCTECTDYRKDKPVMGMDIITNLVYDGRIGEYKDGQILDPTSGELYNCKAWVGKDGFLRIRGYMVFVGLGKTYVLPKYIPGE